MCVICNHSTGFLDGFNKVRNWERDSDGLIGIGKLIYDGTMTVHKKEKLKEQSKTRSREREEARQLLLAKQRKQLYD